MGSVELHLSLGYAVSPAPFRPFLGLMWPSGAGPAAIPRGLPIQVHVLTSVCASQGNVLREKMWWVSGQNSGLATLGHLSRSGPIPVAGERNE